MNMEEQRQLSRSTENDHICSFCNCKFLSKAALADHIKSSHDLSGLNGRDSKQRNHICSFCGSGYTLRRILTRHIRATHDSNFPFANGRGRRMSFLVDEEIDGSESPQALPETGPVIVDLTGEDRCSTPSLLSMETIKRVRPSLQLPEPSPATPAGTLRSTRKRARSTSQKSADSRSSSPEMSHRTSRRACREASNTANSAKAAKPYLKKPPVDYPTFRSRRAGLKKSMPKCLLVRPAGLKNPKPKSLLPVLESRGTTPGDSVDAQLPPAPLPPAPEPQASQPKPSPSKDVIFHFFLANEDHGAIPQPFEHCGTMSSFFDEALAAWGALGEDQPQPRMAAVKVIMEGIGRPTVVLWRNKEGFSRMMDMVLEQAAEKQTKFNVEVRCFKRG